MIKTIVLEQSQEKQETSAPKKTASEKPEEHTATPKKTASEQSEELEKSIQKHGNR